MKNTISNSLFDELFKELKVRKQQISQEESDDAAVLVCGDTGAGKSTIINYLLGKELFAKERENSYQLVIECTNPISEIGHQNISTTSVPQKHKLSKLSYWDCPGFEDTAGEVADIINAYAISKIQHTSKKLKILALIEEHNLLSPLRGGIFRELITKLTKMFDNNNESSLADSITLCFTKSGQITEYKDFLLDMLEEIKPGGVHMDQKSKELLRLVIEKEKFIKFTQPEEIALIPLLDKESIIQKISNSTFLENTEITPVVSSKTQEFFAKKVMVYFNEKIEQDMSLIFDEICKYITGLEKNTFSNFVDKFSAVLAKNDYNGRKESLIITQLKELSKDINLSKEFEDVEFMISEVFEFLSYKILGKGNTNNNIVHNTVDILYKKIQDIQENNEINQNFEENKDKSFCERYCNIFIVIDIKYNNELLNHLDMFNKLSAIYGVNKALNLSEQFSPLLISEAIETQNSDLLLGAAMSLDIEEY